MAVAMKAGDKLKTGMGPLEVCRVLLGWRCLEVHVIGHFTRYHTWDFVSPGESEVIRVTFDGSKLLAWGEPGDGIPIAPPDVKNISQD